MLQIIKRHQYLRGCQALRFQQLRPFMRQRDLACSGGRLRVLYAASSALGQFQPPRAQSDRARRDNDDLLPRRMTFSNFFHDGLQPILADMALATDQKGRTDLDNDTVPVSRVAAFYRGDHPVSSERKSKRM